MDYLLAHRFIYSLISALALSAVVSLSHAFEDDSLSQAHLDALQSYLSSYSYKAPESCPESTDQGHCWARSVMMFLSEQELGQIYIQVAEQLEYFKDQPVNAAALHLYLESDSKDATQGVPVNHLNMQLAVLLQKTVLTVTLLPGGLIATQLFTGFENGSYDIEENIISLSEEPEALVTAIFLADISLLLTPGVNGGTGHIQPIVFSLPPQELPNEAALQDSLDSIVNRPARVIDILAVSTGDIPSYFGSSQQYGAQFPSAAQMRRERLKREQEAARKKLEQQAREARKHASEEYHQDKRARFCKQCATTTAALSIIGATSAAAYQHWDAVKSHLQSFWEETIVPRMPLIARMDGMGWQGDTSELARNMESFYQEAKKAGQFLYSTAAEAYSGVSKTYDTLRKFAPLNTEQPPEGFARQMLEAVNAIRSKPQVCNNVRMPAVAPLSWNNTLTKAAERHSKDMARNHFMEHSGSDGSSVGDRTRDFGYRWSSVSENIAAGYPDLDSVIKGWMSSTTGHCEGIMDPDMIEMGASVIKSNENRPYWTQVFARPSWGL